MWRSALTALLLLARLGARAEALFEPVTANDGVTIKFISASTACDDVEEGRRACVDLVVRIDGDPPRGPASQVVVFGTARSQRPDCAFTGRNALQLRLRFLDDSGRQLGPKVTVPEAVSVAEPGSVQQIKQHLDAIPQFWSWFDPNGLVNDLAEVRVELDRVRCN